MNFHKFSCCGMVVHYRISKQKLLTMKLTAILLLATFLHVSAFTTAQKVTLKYESASLEKVIKNIKQQTGYNFFYSNNMLKKSLPVSIDMNDVPLEIALQRIFDEQPLAYTIEDKTIIVRLRPSAQKAFANNILAAAQNYVHGQVTDSSGQPIVGVSVMLVGSKQGTSTDSKGMYSLAAKEGDVLLFSYVGYRTQEVTVGQSDEINVQLTANPSTLNEVVVVGYGTQKKVNVTGAVATVTAKDFANRPVTNVTNAIQGKMSGVTITTTNGQPGRDGGTIRIRGIGSGIGPSDISANAGPAVIIDGVPGSLSDINPDDIDNISVLKDAASSAIYGARASNGVILVTTKKGRMGSLQVRYNMYVGKQNITRRPDFLPSWQQAELYNEALENEGKGKNAKWSDDDIQKFKDGSDKTGAHPNTDWLSLFYTEPGLQQYHNLNLNGGDAKTKYMFSLGYFDQKGNVKKTSYQKYNALFNISSQFTKKLSVNAGIGYLYAPFSEPVSTYATSFSQIIRQINRISNTVPYKWENGALGYVSDGSPMAWMEAPSTNKWQNYTITGNAGLDFAPVEGLHLKPSFGYRMATGQQQQYVADIQYYKGGAADVPLDPTKYQGPNNLTNATDRTTYTLLQLVGDYEKRWDKHYFKILVGGSQEYSKYNTFSAYRQGFLNNSLTEINAGPASGQKTTGYANDWGLESYFGRVNYNFDERYLAEVNFRFDGSSRFAPGHRWGKFPSLSIGWVISKEAFFAPLSNTFNLLKLRAAWGKLGNQQIANNYAYFESVAGGKNYSFNQNLVTGIAPDAGGNTDLSWEKTESYDIGLDAAILQNKLSIAVDWFVRNTNNPLMSAQTGEVYGFKPPYVNVDGGLSNKGIEFTVGYKDNIGDFRYEVNGNFSYITNKVTKLTGGPQIGVNGAGTILAEGLPFYSLYGYQAIGIYQTTDDLNKYPATINSKVGPGDIIYKDQDNSGTIDANDRVYLGSYFPKTTYGFTLSGNWKNFDLSVFFQGAAGVKAMGGNMIGQVGPDVQKPTSVFLDRWTPENHSTTFPRVWYSYSQNDPNTNPSSFWVKDASYLRLKNLTFGYNIPESLVKRIGLNHIKFYYSGQNIWTITKFYKWIDPEVGAAGSIYSYPQVVTHTIGLNVTF
ncbi:TonB-dependent receptor [Paracnuella aquatica]